MRLIQAHPQIARGEVALHACINNTPPVPRFPPHHRPLCQCLPQSAIALLLHTTSCGCQQPQKPACCTYSWWTAGVVNKHNPSKQTAACRKACSNMASSQPQHILRAKNQTAYHRARITPTHRYDVLHAVNLGGGALQPYVGVRLAATRRTTGS